VKSGGFGPDGAPAGLLVVAWARSLGNPPPGSDSLDGLFDRAGFSP